MSAPRHALVTGATGGLGLTLVPTLLAAGYRVRATGRSAAVLDRLAAMGAEPRPADLTDPQALPALCAGVNVVFHAAALSSPWGPFETFERINVTATRQLLAAANGAGCDGFIFVSSPSIYAAPRDRVALTEDSPPEAPAMNAYAATKLAAERLVLAADGPRMKTVAIRPRAVMGPDDSVLLPRLLRIVRRGRFPLINGGQALVELTDVRDACRALLLADEHRAAAAGQAVNISGGRPVTIRKLVEALGEVAGRPIRFKPVSVGAVMRIAGLLETAYGLVPGRPEPPVTRYGVATLAFSQTFDLSRARSLLGYEPHHDAVASARETAAQVLGRA
ncbi:nucleoside-diphosphate-sugar epimerase [Sphingomonas zeicaulis]|uniref:NAD-dependent epimerase/dehydratase family protein n=1 Tax=Sphingomonas zeicaulis TaxID=1632740 RepID=UPI003D216880